MAKPFTRLALVALAGLFSLGAAAVEAPPMPYTRMGAANGCFVETVAFLDSLHAKLGAEAWSRLLQWDGGREDAEQVVGHAVGIVELRGKVWCWDINYGWTALQAAAGRRDDVGAVGSQASARYGRAVGPNFIYRFDVDQPAGEAPKQPTGDAGGGAAGDALMVAQRLAARRPVNLVTFAIPSGGVDRQSAVAIFLFNGRYCVYSPEIGTVPFHRQPGTVKTITTYQAALRRMFPGAHEFKTW